jgi:hypothetical protein
VRGKTQPNGATRISLNGYHYTKKDGTWYLTHRLIAEEALGRPLSVGEQAIFKDRDRRNLAPDNIEVRTKNPPSLKKRLAILEARRDEVQAEIELVKKQIAEQKSIEDLTALELK